MTPIYKILRIITFCLTLVLSFLIIGCVNIKEDKEDVGHSKYFKGAGDKYRIIKVDGCEYILFYGNNNELRFDGITHKGNCKNH